MNKPQQEGKKYTLSNLSVNSIGLVRRGANRSPFFFVKSADGTQGEDMSDKEKVQIETPDSVELEEFRAWKAAQANPPAAIPPADEPTATPDEMVDFAEMLALQEKRLAEEFAAKLEVEQSKTAKLAEAFAESENKRRLREFTDVASTYSLPISGVEQFGEDLMAIKDRVGDEVYERLVTMLRATDEAVKQGDLFSQFAQPEQGETGDPFLAKVTVIQNRLLETDPRKDSNEAFADAVKLAQERHPDLAAKYAKGGA